MARPEMPQDEIQVILDTAMEHIRNDVGSLMRATTIYLEPHERILGIQTSITSSICESNKLFKRALELRFRLMEILESR